MIFLELTCAGVKALTMSDYKISHLGCSQLFWWLSCLMFELSTVLNEDFFKKCFFFLASKWTWKTNLSFHCNPFIPCILCSHSLKNGLNLSIFYGYALLTHSGYIIFVSFSLSLLISPPQTISLHSIVRSLLFIWGQSFFSINSILFLLHNSPTVDKTSFFLCGHSGINLSVSLSQKIEEIH